MKKIFCVAILVFITGVKSFGQDYSLDSTRIHAQGNPGEMFHSALLVTNNTANPLTFHINRILKDLPPNWTSCFCYPICIAPWSDTLTFSIPPFGTDSIKPNFGTDSVPGIGYITTVLYIQDLESFSPEDTIYFTGSTLSTGISEIEERNIRIYPNPVSKELFIACKTLFSAELFSANGEKVLSFISPDGLVKEDVSQLSSGIYFLKIITGNKAVVKKIIKQ